jgi:hypothetical protein
MTTQSEVDLLNIEYKKYIDDLRSKWRQRPENQSRSKDVYEVMSEYDRAIVHAIMNRWPAYITPFAEAWWRERGYEVRWPDSDSEPMQVRKLETV